MFTGMAMRNHVRTDDANEISNDLKTFTHNLVDDDLQKQLATAYQSFCTRDDHHDLQLVYTDISASSMHAYALMKFAFKVYFLFSINYHFCQNKVHTILSQSCKGG